MMRQRTRLGWWVGMGLVGAVVALVVAACGGGLSAPAAPPGPAVRVLSSSDSGNANSDDIWTVLNHSSRVAAPEATTAAAVAPAGPQLMSPAEAQAAAPFAYAVPAWAPTGFQLQPQAEVITPPASGGFASVTLSWQNAAGAAIELAISQDPLGLGLTGAGSDPRPVQIGDQLGNLSHQSGFGADRLLLAWTRGALSYRLSADAEAVPRDDLLRMAESVQ